MKLNWQTMRNQRQFKKMVKVLCAIFVLFTSSFAYGQQNDDKKVQKPVIDQSQAIQNARQRFEGRVLRVDRMNQNYRIKMLQKSGRVVSIDVNRNTGRVVQQSIQPAVKKEK